MQSKLKLGLRTLTSTVLLFFCTAGVAYGTTNEGEKIISCQGERKGAYDPTNTYGPEIVIEVYQAPSSQFRWILKVLGKTQGMIQTNGPINPDGTTVAPNGDEGLIYYGSATEGVKLNKEGGSLRGVFSYIAVTFNEQYNQDEYYLVEYALTNCRLTGVKIDQREARIYNAKSELSDLAVSPRPFWLNGAGVKVNEQGLAEGIGIYAQDQAQLDAFVVEFVKRGLVTQTSTGLHYNYKGADQVSVSIPLFVEITGDITFPSLKPASP